MTDEDMETLVTYDLNIKGDAAKWRQAKTMAKNRHSRGFEYWMTARECFLNLGGSYL